MNGARNLTPEQRFKAAQLNVEMGDWVHGLAPWQVIAHLTFAWEASVWSALWCDCQHRNRRDTWREWFHRYGRNRIEPVNSRDDVADYCAKYVTKEGSWWDVKLLDQRHPQNATFRLE